MESKLLKIKLKNSTQGEVKKLVDKMNHDIDSPRKEMAQKGYFWDSVFVSEEGGEAFMYVMLKSDDFSQIIIDDNAIEHTEFREYYSLFRDKFWHEEGYTEPTAVACFNAQMAFDKSKLME